MSSISALAWVASSAPFAGLRQQQSSKHENGTAHFTVNQVCDIIAGDSGPVCANDNLSAQRLRQQLPLIGKDVGGMA